MAMVATATPTALMALMILMTWVLFFENRYLLATNSEKFILSVFVVFSQELVYSVYIVK